MLRRLCPNPDLQITYKELVDRVRLVESTIAEHLCYLRNRYLMRSQNAPGTSLRYATSAMLDVIEIVTVFLQNRTSKTSTPMSEERLHALAGAAAYTIRRPVLSQR